MINIKKLEQSLSKIEKIGQEELDFEAAGVKITLRPLTPFEEEASEAYAEVAKVAPLSDLGIPAADVDHLLSETDSDGDVSSEDRIRMRIWLDRLRVGVLAYSIVEIDGQDLRSSEYLLTGDVDDNGNPISVSKSEFLCELISSWNRKVLTQMFTAYSELMDRVSLRSSKLLSFKPAEIEEEKRRLRNRLASLEQHQAQSMPGSRISEDTALDSASKENEAQQKQWDAIQQVEKKSPQPQHDAHQPQYQAHQEAQVSQEPQPQHDPLPLGGDSMLDAVDPEEAIRAENARQEILLRQRQAQQNQNTLIQGESKRPSSIPSSLPQQHLQEARDTAKLAQNASIREEGGVQIYRTPTVTLEKRGESHDTKVNIDPKPSTGSLNPRFVSAKKRGW